MPVTANLLRKFYETFGKEVTVELVDWANEMDASHRTELKELADQYYDRFDAKLEQRLAETKAELRQEIAALRIEFHTELAGLRNEMHAGFAALRGDMIKWMFTFWAGSAVTTVATVWGVVSLIK